MANKSDVKAIMARFQASGASIDDSTPVGRPKVSLQPTLSSGPALQKKPVLESLSGSAMSSPSKQPFLKSTPSSKSDSDPHEPNKAKALASKFGNSTDDTTTNKPPGFNKVQTPLKPQFSQAADTKGPVQKSPFNKPPLNSTMHETKPAFPKPPGALNSKPSWMKEDSDGGTPPNTSPTPPKAPNVHQKPSSVLKMWQQNEEQPETKTDPVNKLSPQPHTAPKPPTNFKNAQSLFNKEKDPSEPTESGGVSKAPFAAGNSVPPQKPHANRKPSLKKPSNKGPAQAGGINSDPPPGLKRNPLPNSLALGPPPAKPNRPPKVDLEGFKRAAEAPEDGPGYKKPTVPTPMASNLSSQTNHAPQIQASPTLPPVLPARHAAMNPSDDAPPPPPPVFGRPVKGAKEENDDDEEEMYEDLDDRWEEADKNQDKKKEEKRRLEVAKKEQKEREKKEQEARKKFKLNGSLEVIQKGKARTDCKGGKMDLALKQGDQLDIIRVQGNPEGKWLARTADGSIGYVKTTLVEIDFNSLKNRPAHPAYEPEIYDDIDVFSADNGGMKAPAVVLPPPPGEDGEIYDDVVDPNLEVRLPAPDQFAAAGNSDRPIGAPIDEEIYDDVDSQSAPPPPPIASLPGVRGKNKAEDKDPKKQKKFEKEEKEFRKKFKYDGEIQVLYQVTIISPLNNKKWSGKDLPLKGGEKLDVVVKAQDDKLICRNEEGKFGYVSSSHVVDDGEIYDDIGGDDCIYDND